MIMVSIIINSLYTNVIRYNHSLTTVVQSIMYRLFIIVPYLLPKHNHKYAKIYRQLEYNSTKYTLLDHHYVNYF